MGKKIILGGLAGAVLVFIVSSLWHTVLGLGEVGIKSLPNEEAVQAALRASITQPGFYFFPAPNMTPGRSKEQRAADDAAYASKYRQGPNGILIYSPGGTDFNFGKALLNQFLFNLVAALILAWILAVGAAGTSFGGRALIVLLASIFAGVVFILPYWNWYNFPLNYVLGDMAGWAVSWGIGGLGMAKIVKA
jgi:hypothetical protein